MLARIQIRRDTYQNWFDNNPILFAGEIGFETTRIVNGIEVLSNKFKIGDGVSNWNSLDYQLGQWSVDTVNQELHYNDLDVAIDKNLSIGESLEIAKNLIVHGDFLIKGKTTTINNKNVTFNDSVLTLNWSEDPITPYQTELLSGIEINTGLDEVSTLMEGNLLITSISYDLSSDETTVELSEQLQTSWPYPYYQNKVLYYSHNTDPSLNKIFSIKSYNNQNRQIKLIGDASSSLSNSDYVHIHNTKKQIVWGNTPFFEGWYIDDNLHVNGVITSDGTATWVVIPDSTDIFYDLGNVAIGNLTTSEKLEVDCAVKIVKTSTVSPSGGEIKYDSNDFFGHDGTEWKSLTSGGGSISYNDLTDKPTIPSSLTDLSISDGSNGQFLKTDGNGNFSFSNFVESDTLDNVLERSNLTTRDIKTSGKIYFSNVFTTEAELFAVNASTYHGMFAHAHDTGSAYFSHSGSWVKLANFNDISSGGGAAYTNSDVDTHLNKDVNSDGKVLSWDAAADGGSGAYAWIDAPSGGNASVTISDSEPTEKSSGDLWWESDNGVLRIYYTDTDNDSYWIDIPSSTTNGTSSSGDSYTDSNVNALLNKNADSDGKVLSWNQNSDSYTWIDAPSGGSGSSYITDNNSEVDVSTNLNVDGVISIDGAQEKFTTNSNEIDSTETTYTYMHIMTDEGTDEIFGIDSLYWALQLVDEVIYVESDTHLIYLGKVTQVEPTVAPITSTGSLNYTRLKLIPVTSDDVTVGTGNTYHSSDSQNKQAEFVNDLTTYDFSTHQWTFPNQPQKIQSVNLQGLGAPGHWTIIPGSESTPENEWNTNHNLPDGSPSVYSDVESQNPTLDCSSSYVHMIDGNILTNFSINITNLNLEDSHVCVVTIFVQQGADAYIPNTLQLSGVEKTIKWQGNSPPTPTSNGIDVFSFTILRNASNYTILGQGIPFGG